MIFDKKKFCFAIALLSAIVFSLPLNAATLDIDNEFFGYNWISVTYNDSGTIKKFKPDAGTLKVKYEGYDTWGFCVDLGVALDLSKPTNSYTYTTQNPVDYNANLVYVEWLLDEYGQNAYSTTNGKATFGAALQLAIWEVLYDGVGSTTTNFSYTWTTAEETKDEYVDDFYYEYLNALTNAITGGLVSSGNYVVAELVDLQGKDSQDIIVKVVPEPTTALLLGFGLLGLCAVGRKRD